MMMQGRLFPTWQIDEDEYRTVCAYLGISPKAHLYEKVSAYLASAPFRFKRPRGFALFLAGVRLTRFRLARMDQATRLFFPEHPVRHVLNCVIGLHECDGEGYRELASAPAGWRAALAIAGWLTGYGFALMVTLAWLGWNFLAYVAGTPFRREQNLAGKRILITGVNRGLGRDLMLHALEQGAEVIGTVRSQEALDNLAAELPREAPARLLVADISQPGALPRVLTENRTQAEAIDLAILCAGVKHGGTSVLAMPALRETFEVNYFSTVDFANWFCAGNSRKSLVLVSSIGRWHGMHLTGGYNASKAALSIWGESLEMELRAVGKQHIDIMIVEPGIFESGMMKRSGVAKLLLTSRRDVAKQILSGAMAGKKSLRPPFWFAVLTWAVCLGGRNLRYRLFARIK
ncbi:MAG TPA: SDR family NAD(P)-dependent oxidoreductase [Gammaproteobacteria bacterium]|nr:SDR family NAD(P)-dependent oxidoreductase [Gammaproteobacteria bacterium]